MEEKKTISKLYDDYIEGNIRTSKKYKEISNKFVDRIERFRDK